MHISFRSPAAFSVSKAGALSRRSSVLLPVSICAFDSPFRSGVASTAVRPSRAPLLPNVLTNASYRSLSSRRYGTRRSATPICRATRLVVVELETLLRDNDAVPAGESSPVQLFAERVEVDRSSARNTAYVVYSWEGLYEDAMALIEKVGLPEADALVTAHGSELYQRRYREPDPYWERIVRKDWDPKPVRWVVGEYFGDKVVEREAKTVPASKADFQLAFAVKNDTSDVRIDEAELLRDNVKAKVKEMGLTVRAAVRKEGSGYEIVLSPATGDVGEVVSFIATMLKVNGPASICAYGAPEFVHVCLQSLGALMEKAPGYDGDPNSDVVGIMPHACRNPVDKAMVGRVSSGQVFVAKSNSVPALLDGLVHYAMF